MRRTPTLAQLSAALTIAALGAGVTVSPLRAETITPPAKAVTRISVVPTDGKAAIVIGVDSAVTLNDFTLGKPNRLVLDVTGARLRTRARVYDRLARGAIKNVRVAQYKPDVVRVVIELDSLIPYEISRADGELRIALDGSVGEFAAWHSAGAAAVAAKPDATKAVAASAEARPDVQPEARVAKAEPKAAEPTPRAYEPPSKFGDAAGQAAQAAPARAAEPTPEPVAPAVVPMDEPEPPAARQREERRSSGGMMPVRAQSQQPRITVTYQDADIRDVIAAFAAFSGRTIVVGREVTGTVTAEIRDQPWDVALRAILLAQGLSAGEDATGIIAVDSYKNIASRQASEPLETRLVALNYAKASSLQETVRLLLSRDCGDGPMAAPGGGGGGGGGSCQTRGAVAVDTATNTLLITEAPSRMGDLLGYIQALDVRTPQVAIKAKIIFVSRTDVEQLGLTYDLGSPSGYSNRLLARNGTGGGATSPDAVVRLGGDALVGVANANRRFVSTAAINLLYSTAIGNYTLTTFLDALQEIRLADTQAEPNIVTLDNRSASILVGEETPIRVVDASSAGSLARANVTFKESGIRLDVTPHITNNRQIMMTLHAEQSQLQAAAADIGFTFLKRRADSQVLVNDGETAVFGGLTLTQVTTSKSGIPFLVDLPLIGRLFGETSTQEAKQDMLVLVTPHIIDEGETPRSR